MFPGLSSQSTDVFFLVTRLVGLVYLDTKSEENAVTRLFFLL